MRGVNLIPAHRRHAADIRRRVRLWCAAGGVYTLGLIAICLFVQLSHDDDRVAAAALDTARSHAVHLQSDVVTARQQLARTAAARENLSVLVDPPDWSLLLDGLAQIAGNEIVLREIHLSPDSTDAGPADHVQRVELRLHGICPTPAALSALVTHLQTIGLFHTIDLVRSGREPFQNGSVISFDIRCVIDGQVAPVEGQS